MKKIFLGFIFSTFIFFISIIIILSTVGIETNKFNSLISEKLSETKNINLKLKKIQFKIDLKKLSLFLQTTDPKISYKEASIPISTVKAYVDFTSLLKSKPKIKKINLNFKEIDIIQLNELSVMIKPSNFKSLLNNNVKEGKLISDIEIFLMDDGSLKNFIAKGTVNNLKAEIFNDLNLNNASLSFFADKNDVLIKNIFGDLEGIKIHDGDLKLNLEEGIKLSSNFNSKINFKENQINYFLKLLKKNNTIRNINSLKADFNNTLSIELDNTYKVINYNYSIAGKIAEGKFSLLKPIESIFIKDKIKEVYFSDLQFETTFDSKQTKLKGKGKYSFNNLNFYNLNLENSLKKDLIKLKLDFDYGNNFKIDLINYTKSDKSVANLSLEFEKKNNFFYIKNFIFKERKNFIKLNGINFKNNKFLTFKKIEVSTPENDFFIKNDKKISIKGNKFDGTKLGKFFNNKAEKNLFENINSQIEIDFQNIKIPLSEKLENFKLIGQIKKGQFIKISSKGDFGGNNFLDISMKKDKNSNKKYLEIYSDLTRPLLTEYSFFNGLSGGKLLFTSIIDDSKSSSKLKIEKFKVVNAPGVIKLLSLADLKGLADLAEGDGLSFDILEIDMEKNKNSLRLNEILALGPSMSVLMEGYQEESGLISLRGTLVPAKTLNKMISKIPLIGDIVIPKEVGEGLFGVSFKMKGTKGKIKTTINPIKTLTPRFIQKILDRNK